MVLNTSEWCSKRKTVFPELIEYRRSPSASTSCLDHLLDPKRLLEPVLRGDLLRQCAGAHNAQVTSGDQLVANDGTEVQAASRFIKITNPTPENVRFSVYAELFG